MFIVGQCKKCKSYGIMNIENHNKKEVNDFLKKAEFGECPFGGWHVELGKMDNFIELDWNEIYESKEKAQKVANNREEKYKC